MQATIARAMIGAGDAPLFVSILSLCGEKFPDIRSTLFGFTLFLCKAFFSFFFFETRVPTLLPLVSNKKPERTRV